MSDRYCNNVMMIPDAVSTPTFRGIARSRSRRRNVLRPMSTPMLRSVSPHCGMLQPMSPPWHFGRPVALQLDVQDPRPVSPPRDIQRPMASPNRACSILILDWDQTLSAMECDAEFRAGQWWGPSSSGDVPLSERSFWIQRFGGEVRSRQVEVMLQQVTSLGVECVIVSHNVIDVLSLGVQVMGWAQFFTSRSTGRLRIIARQSVEDHRFDKGIVIKRLMREKQPAQCLFVDDGQDNIHNARMLCGPQLDTILIERGTGGMATDHWQRVLASFRLTQRVAAVCTSSPSTPERPQHRRNRRDITPEPLDFGKPAKMVPQFQLDLLFKLI